MASTYTTSGRLAKQGTGDNLNTWGLKLNQQALDLIDEMIAGSVTVPIAGDTTLTSLNGQSDQSRPAQLVLTGSPAANFTVTTPNVPKLYVVDNQTTKIATFTTGAGDTVAIDPTDVVLIMTDGTDWKTLSYGGLSLKAYISSVAAGGPGGNVPSPIGNSGKFLTNNGTISYWFEMNTSQLADLAAYTAARRAEALAFAIAFGG